MQPISECRLSISLEIRRVLLSPQEFPIDILLSMLAAHDVAGEEAEALNFLGTSYCVAGNLVHKVFMVAATDRVTAGKSGRGLGLA